MRLTVDPAREPLLGEAHLREGARRRGEIVGAPELLERGLIVAGAPQLDALLDERVGVLRPRGRGYAQQQRDGERPRQNAARRKVSTGHLGREHRTVFSPGERVSCRSCR